MADVMQKLTPREMWQLAIALRRIPVPEGDPPPPWLKLTRGQIREFAAIQARFNAKLAEIDAERVREIEKLLGPMM